MDKSLSKMNLKDKSIFIAGHKGMVGRAVLEELKCKSKNIFTVNKDQLDLRDEYKVKNWFESNKPEIVIMAAAKVGGILANNSFPVDFLEYNLRIQNNIIRSSHEYEVKKLIFLGSSCIYPKNSPQPIKENYLLSGFLEPTNEWYAIAKLAGIKLCEAYNNQYNSNFISVIPTNIFGPNDNYHPEYSHVPAALIRKFHEAKVNEKDIVSVWGTGQPKREFLHVKDLARAIIFMLENYSSKKPINIGTGKDISINDFAYLVAEVVGYKGKILFDDSKPDGMMLKRLDVSKSKLMGWNAEISLVDGIHDAYHWALNNIFN